MLLSKSQATTVLVIVLASCRPRASRPNLGLIHPLLLARRIGFNELWCVFSSCFSTIWMFLILNLRNIGVWLCFAAEMCVSRRQLFSYLHCSSPVLFAEEIPEVLLPRRNMRITFPNLFFYLLSIYWCKQIPSL